MKKLILTTVTVLFVAMSSIAQDGSKCQKKCDNKGDMKACATKENCMKNNGEKKCTSDMKCDKHDAKCEKNCQMNGEKKANKGTPGK